MIEKDVMNFNEKIDKKFYKLQIRKNKPLKAQQIIISPKE